MYGDSLGMVNMIIADTSEPFKSRDLLCTEHTQDYICLHEKHTEWVTKVPYSSIYNMLASSTLMFHQILTASSASHAVQYHACAMQIYTGVLGLDGICSGSLYHTPP